MPVGNYFNEKAVIFLKSRGKTEAFRELAEFFCSCYPAVPVKPERRGEQKQSSVSAGPEFNGEFLFGKIVDREQTLSTWISRGIAIPHVILPGFSASRIALGISRPGIAYDSPDEEPVHLLVLIVGDGAEHLEILRQIALRLSSPHVYENVLRSSTREDAYRAFVDTGEVVPSSRDDWIAVSQTCLRHARALAGEVGASHIFVHTDCLENSDIFFGDSGESGDIVLFVTISKFGSLIKRFPENRIIQIPFKGITRANQIELSVIFALSRGLVDKSERVISVFGLPCSGILDTIRITEISREFKIFFALNSGAGTSDLEHRVLVRAIEIAGELAEEGREGKPSGCIFVLGDYGQVRHHCQQMIINPFKGYSEGELNILDPSLKETVKELSKIDGAFIVRGDGILVSAGTYLRTRIPLGELPSGLGARHAAAAAITMLSRAVSIALSESTRKISLFKNGERIMEL
jgi:DNA integrity scanning protein DisA with diadenylate cyclase activity/mannitol/fructose-specific phosphotransferase system IIA component (Ntr-type)